MKKSETLKGWLMSELKLDPKADPKKPWQSKTVLVNALVGIAPFIPGATEWIMDNPTAFGAIVGLLNIGLRSVTGEGVSWKLFDKKF